jgi:predicted nucleic acid-binding protein
VITYFDTSAFVKTVVVEEGSDVAVEIWNSSAIRVTSIVAYAEARAALAAAVRSRRLAPGARQAARADLDDRWRALAVRTVTDEVVGLAGDLADREALRACDAVHLASALLAGEGNDVLLATWDRALSRAARRLGVRTNLAWTDPL